MALVVAIPVNADTYQWTQGWELTDWDTDETTVRLDICLTVEKEIWQGGTFTYTTEFDVDYWDQSLSKDSDKIRAEGVAETFEFDIEFGDNLECGYQSYVGVRLTLHVISEKGFV